MNTIDLPMNKTAKPTAISPAKINVIIGVVGMLIAMVGNLLPFSDTQKWCYLLGGILLLISSALERQIFFIALQIIIVAGAAVAFSSWPVLLKAALPIVLSVAAIVYFAKRNLLTDRLMLFGSLGIAILAAGYAVSNPVIYLLGAFVLMIYSFMSFRRGVKIALVWAILNALFSITAAVTVYHYL